MSLIDGEIVGEYVKLHCVEHTALTVFDVTIISKFVSLSAWIVSVFKVILS